MILVWFAFTFLGGLMLGYMLFNDSPKNYKYKFKINGKTYDLVFKIKKTEFWDDMDGIGSTTKYEYVELKEDNSR